MEKKHGIMLGKKGFDFFFNSIKTGNMRGGTVLVQSRINLNDTGAEYKSSDFCSADVVTLMS